jgi:hypothetical protein
MANTNFKNNAVCTVQNTIYFTHIYRKGFQAKHSPYQCALLGVRLTYKSKILMFCWPCIIVYQYNETNVMYFSFSLLRIKGPYMFQALLAHTQEPLNKRHLVYCVLKSVGCVTNAVSLQSWHSQLTYACNIPSAVCSVPPEDEHVMLETCRGSRFSIKWMNSSSRWFHYAEIQRSWDLLEILHFLQCYVTPVASRYKNRH